MRPAALLLLALLPGCVADPLPPVAPGEIPDEVPISIRSAVRGACRAEGPGQVIHHLDDGRILLRDEGDWRMWYRYDEDRVLEYRLLDFDADGAVDRIWTHRWPAPGRLEIVETTHPVWDETWRMEVTFDADGREVRWEGTELRWNRSHYTENTYDADGRLERRVGGDPSGHWRSLRRRSFEWDDRLMEEIRWGNDAGAGLEGNRHVESTARFDRRGRLVNWRGGWLYSCLNAPAPAPADDAWHPLPSTWAPYGPRIRLPGPATRPPGSS